MPTEVLQIKIQLLSYISKKLRMYKNEKIEQSVLKENNRSSLIIINPVDILNKMVITYITKRKKNHWLVVVLAIF